MNDQQWRDSLNRHFADFEQPEPEGVWEEVERRMATGRQPAPRPISPLSGRILRLVGLTGAAAAIIAGIFLVGRNAFHADPPETGMTATTGTLAADLPRSEVPAIRDGETATAVADHSTEPVSTAKHTHPYPTLPDPSAPVPPTPVIVSETGSATAGDGTVGVELSETPAAEDPEPAKPSAPDKRRPAADSFENGDPFAPIEPKPRRSKGKGWSTRILASSAPGSGSTRAHGGYGSLTASTAPSSDAFYGAMLGDNAMTDILILNRDTQPYTETRHNLPVRAGVMLGYDLTERLGIESGLIYTHLASRLKSGSQRYYYETRQSLHYLGIPVKLNYSLWQSRLLKIYVSGGGMAEWNVSGNASTEYTHDGKIISKENSRVRIDEPQWSVNASLGLQLNLSRRVGIFADPGISYHFDNDSPVETAYKKNPLNFDLTLGLRISLKK